jgi:hypothetical protein
MKVTRILAALTLVVGFAGVAHAQGCARLSWGTCDPWVENANYNPAVFTYLLVESAIGVDAANVGHDSNIHIGAFSGALPDSWRFDDAGCQTADQLLLATSAGPCPTLRGASSLPTTNFYVDPVTGEADLRLSLAYDQFVPSPGTRYVLWKLTFDHSRSKPGPSDPANLLCGGVELCQNLNLTTAFFLDTNNIQHHLGSCDSDPAYPTFPSGFATWNGGCRPVATEPSTWGRVKGMYH